MPRPAAGMSRRNAHRAQRKTARKYHYAHRISHLKYILFTRQCAKLQFARRRCRTLKWTCGLPLSIFWNIKIDFIKSDFSFIRIVSMAARGARVSTPRRS